MAKEALAWALYCVCSHRRDYAETVRMGANSGGDSDSIACIAGAIRGAYLGAEAVPSDWVRRIESADVLNQLSQDLLASGFVGKSYGEP